MYATMTKDLEGPSWDSICESLQDFLGWDKETTDRAKKDILNRDQLIEAINPQTPDETDQIDRAFRYLRRKNIERLNKEVSQILADRRKKKTSDIFSS